MKKDNRVYILIAIAALILAFLFIIGNHVDSSQKTPANTSATEDPSGDLLSQDPDAQSDGSVSEAGSSAASADTDGSPDPSTGFILTDGEGIPFELGEEDGQYMVVSVDEFQENAEMSVNMWEFLQRFYKDIIVYKNETGFVYAPVDKTLPQSDYDWNCLVELGLDTREVSYVENGEEKSIKGIDVSRYQGEIDWSKVAASGVKYAFIRLGYRGYSTGALVLDELFEQNVTGALENGIAVGVYFVTQAVTEDEAREEAQFVLDAIAPYNVTWPIVLDIEEAGDGNARTALLTSDQRTDFIVAFCEKIISAGKRPMLYANIRWFVERMDLTRLTSYDKWFAQYFNRPFFPYAFQIWQYTSSGHVDGIEGKVDLNISFVDYGKEE